MTALSSYGPPPTCRIPSCRNQATRDGLCATCWEQAAEKECECPPGFHRRGCPLCHWPEGDAA